MIGTKTKKKSDWQIYNLLTHNMQGHAGLMAQKFSSLEKVPSSGEWNLPLLPRKFSNIKLPSYYHTCSLVQ